MGGAVPALIFGVAVGNVLQGVPFELNDMLMPLYPGNFIMKLLGLLNPYALLAGVVSLSMLMMHGAAWLSVKTEGAVKVRATEIGSVAGMVAFVAYILAGIWLAFGITGYHITSVVPDNGPSNPLFSTVEHSGSWMQAYADRPWIAIAPILGLAGIAMAVRGLRAGREVSTLLWSKLGIFGVISSVGLTMFPFILPSSKMPDASLTVWDASSSHQTLFIMLVCALIFMPLILAYTAWVYKVLWGKVTVEDVERDSHTVY